VGFFVLVCSGWIGINCPNLACGSVEASDKRVDVPFTLTVKTPHVAWGQPWSGKIVHVLVVPSVSEGRALVELAEHFPITYNTVMIDSARDVNAWTVETGKNYESRTYGVVYKYLAEDLASSAHYDVIVLPSLFGWSRLPQTDRDVILKRVREGAGLAGEPIVAVKSYGKGGVVALGCVNHGLSPKIDWKFLGKQNDRWWEYFCSLLGRLRFRGGRQEGGFNPPECGWISDVVCEG
jgi:hypothetical protein